MIYIIITPDFINEAEKLDGLYLGCRLNLNAVNIATSCYILKLAVFNKDKIDRVKKFKLFLIIYNLFLLFLLGLLHLRVRKVSNKLYYL